MISFAVFHTFVPILRYALHLLYPEAFDRPYLHSSIYIPARAIAVLRCDVQASFTLAMLGALYASFHTPGFIRHR